jgi:hypothetical protein
MNRKLAILNLSLIPLAAIAGWTLSKATLVGKVGIHFLHREYAFLNSWWKGALFILAVWLIFEFIQFRIWKKYSRGLNRAIQIGFIVLAIVGLYYTYLDFSTFSHGMLGKRFHIGGYLFWIGWSAISIFFLRLQKQEPTVSESNGQQNKF